MSKSNKAARQELERIYGKGCMFQKAYISQRLAKIEGVISYKRFVESKHYKLKKIRQLERNMTYHHLKHKADGGKATKDNGAIVSELAHQYLHSLPRDKEELANNMLRQYKHDFELRGGLMIPNETSIEFQQPFVVDLGFDYGEGYIEIPVYDTTPEQEKKREKFNRAKVKREQQRYIDEVLYGEPEDELDDYEPEL